MLLLGSLSACSGDSSTATPNVAAPRVPTGVVGNGGNTTINIVFTAPASNGSGAITGYTATCSASGSVRTGTATSSPIRVTGLTNGTAYTCSVVATNSAGPSPASSAVTVTPLGVPAAPTGVVAAPSADECEHCLHGPASTGGAPITSYIVTCTEASAPLTGTGATSPITVSGMTSGTTYTCVVAAISAAGTGTASSAVSAQRAPHGCGDASGSADAGIACSGAHDACAARYDQHHP